KRDALVDADRLAKRLPVARIDERFVETGARAGQAHEADQRSRELEALHAADEAVALTADEPLGSDGEAVEVKRRPADRLAAEIPERRALHVTLVKLYIEG